MAFLHLPTLLLVLLTTQCTLGQLTESENDTACHKPADVIFVLDASASIYGPDFRKQLDFVRTIIRGLHIDPSMVRCGLVTYGDQVRVEFGLRTYSGTETAMKAVSLVKQLRGNTRTDLGLRKMREMMAVDRRSGIPQIGIILTDGQSDYPAVTRNQSEMAHSEGIALFAVGIGRDVDQTELKSMASQEDFRFNVGNFNGLKIIRRILTQRACDVESQNDQAPEPQPLLLQNIEGCTDKLADVMFVLDGSGSIWGPDFRRQLKFVSDMVAFFQVSERGTHVGVLTFGDHPIPQFALDRYSTVPDIQRAIEHIVQQKGGTNTADALSYVRQTSFTGLRHRVGAIKIAVVITDGQSNNPRSTAEESIRVKEDGVTVFVIGVGSGADRTELQSIASQPSDQHVFMVENYGALGSVKKRLMSRACLGNRFDQGPLPMVELHSPTATVTNQMAVSTTMKTNIETTQPVKEAVDCVSMKSADVMFALPSSIDDHETRAGLRFIESMSRTMSVGDGLIRVGLAPRLCHAISGFSLDQGNRSDKVSSYIEQQSPSGRVEETAAMLRYLRDAGFSSHDATRAKETEKIALVFVDGRSARLTRASFKEAGRLRQRGIRVVLIVVGRRDVVVEEQLSQMTDCDSCLLSSESYSGLNSLVEPLKRTIMTHLCAKDIQGQ